MKETVMSVSVHFKDAIEWLVELQVRIATEYIPMREMLEREAQGKSTDYYTGMNDGLAAAQTKVRALQEKLQSYLDKR